MGSSKRWPSKAYEDCRYMARTLAVSLQDLRPEQREDVLKFLAEELTRLSDLSDDYELGTATSAAHESDGPHQEEPAGDARS